MRRNTLCALVCLLFIEAALGQQPKPQADSQGPDGIVIQLQPQVAGGRDDEINNLKAAVSQLQDRLNQLAPAPTEGECKSVWPMNAYWKDGLQIESQNDLFRVHVGGQLQFDSGWNAASRAVQFGPGGIGELQDGAVFRRARLQIDGTMYEHIEWVAQFDFANSVDNDTSPSGTPIGSPSFADVWVGANDLPLIGTLRLGWMKEPIAFERLTSSRWLNFMERPPGGDSLGLRSPGIMFLKESDNERVTLAAGFFHAQNDNFGFGIGDGQ